MNVVEVVQSLPEILVYFLPGYIGLFIYKHMRGIDIQESHWFMASCAISFIGITLARLICPLISGVFSFLTGIYLEIIVETLIIIAGVVFFSLLLNSRWFSRVCAKAFKISPSVNVLSDVIDKRGSRVLVKIKGQDYYIGGSVYSYDGESKEPWLSIVFAEFVREGDNKPFRQNCEENHYVVVNLNDVEYVEFWRKEK